MRTLVTLTREFRDYQLPDLHQEHLPMHATKVPSRPEVERAVDLLSARPSAGATWVHRAQGLDRTGVVIGSFLVSRGSDPDRVVADLLDRFPRHRCHPEYLKLWDPYAQLIRSFAHA